MLIAILLLLIVIIGCNIIILVMARDGVTSHSDQHWLSDGRVVAIERSDSERGTGRVRVTVTVASSVAALPHIHVGSGVIFTPPSMDGTRAADG